MHVLAGALRVARLSVFALALTALAGCGGAEGEDAQESADRVSDVPATPVKRQAIGNCWVYATNAWIESLHLKATGGVLDLSEAYTTYWYWFEQLASFPPLQAIEGTPLITEGGNFGRANALVERYGLMREADFAADSMLASFGVSRTKEALEALRKALDASSSPVRRAMIAGDRAALRRALDDVWRLPADTRAELDRVFGADAARTFAKGARAPKGSIVLDPRSLLVATADGPGKVTTAPLFDVLNTWQQVIAFADAVSTKTGRRAFERRIQRALHDGLAVPIRWHVDFKAVTASGTFSAAELRENGASPEPAGGHLSVIVDYEARGVAGFGTLPAGTVEKRVAALEGALDEGVTIPFFRIKNSWGSLPNTPLELVARFGGADFGENDLETEYLYATETSVHLPPGY